MTADPLRVAFLGFVFDALAEQDIRRLAPPEWHLSFCTDSTGIPESVYAGADVIVPVAPLTDEMMGRATRLRFIQKWGSGYEKIDTAAAARRGIPLAITAGANAETIAEHTLMLMLATLRRAPQADAAVRRGEWNPSQLRPVARRLTGKTVGIIGMGNIGRQVAHVLSGFDITLLYYTRRGALPDVGNASYVPLEELLQRADIVTLHAPGGTANRGMIGAEAITMMKPGSYIINVSRGELIDEPALIAALQCGQLAGAGLDVFGVEPLPKGSPLRGLESVVLTPHAAGSVLEDVPIMARHALGNIARYIAGQDIAAADWVVSPEAAQAAKAQGVRNEDH